MGTWLFQLILDHVEVFHRLPGYAHEELVASHMRHATNLGYRPAVLEAFLAPWRGDAGQAAFNRQYSQLKPEHTAEYEKLLGEITIPARLIWGTEDRILPPHYARWLHDRIPHAELHWIEGAGHVLQEDAPAQLLAYLMSAFE